MSLIRSDGWFKSTLGAAIVGANVYVLTQPANTTLMTPQATLYSDSNGLMPLPQPVTTDAFGHYYFYVTPGTYTLLITLNGTTQQVYPDQSLGGSVTTLLETNGIVNTFQATLNLKQGTSLGLTTDGAGGVTLTTTGIDLTFAVQPAWWTSGDGSNYSFIPGNNGRLGSSANAVKFWMVRIPSYIAVGRISLNTFAGTEVAGSVGGFAMYNSSGTVKLFSWDNIDTSIPGLQTFVLPSQIVVPGGIYYFASANSNVGSNPTTQGGYLTLQTSETSQAYNFFQIRSGIGSTVLSAGVMPATLGTLAKSTGIGIIPCICMQP